MLPFLSVVIPSRRRHDRLAALLRSLVKCGYPHDRFEVIVVDEASGAPPRAVLAPFSGHIALAMIELGIGGRARARNAGGKHARGDFLAFIDEDCTPTSGWLSALAARAAPNCAIVGRTVNALPTNLTSEATQAVLDFHSIHFRRDPTRAEIFSASNLAIPANAYRELGGFDESPEIAHGSEQEFCHRWVKSGREVSFLEEAVVLDAHTPSVGSFLREHFHQGIGAVQFDRKHARDAQVSPANEHPTFRELVHYPFERRAGWRAPVLSVLIGVGQAARSLGYFSGRWHFSR